MDDALLVRGFKGLCDLPRDGQRLGDRDRSAADVRGEIFTLDEFHHESARARAGRSADRRNFLSAVNGRDVRMIQRRERLRFASEPRQPLRIIRKRRRQNLDGDVAIELRVTSAEHFAHTARPDGAGDFIRSETHTGQEGHESTQSSPAVPASSGGSPLMPWSARGGPARRLEPSLCPWCGPARFGCSGRYP